MWLLLVLGSTVFTRRVGERKYQLELFWSWKEIFDHRGRIWAAEGNGLILENILNIFLLMPVGILLPVVLNARVHWWQGLLAGAFISAIIESLQLVLCRGLFEFDDIIHNGIGCMAACVVMHRMQKRRARKRRTGSGKNHGYR